jgi:hypothetical protein
MFKIIPQTWMRNIKHFGLSEKQKKTGPWLNHHYSNPGPTPQKMGLLRPGQVKLHLHTVGSSTGRGEDLIFPRTSLSSLGLRENI